MDSFFMQNPELLGQILLIHSAISAAPDESRLMDLVARGFTAIPGVESCAICIEGSIRRLDVAGPRCCTTLSECQYFPQCDAENCHFPNAQGWQRVELRTLRRKYGAIFIIDRGESLTALAGYLGNTANIIALQIERERLAQELEAINRGLDELVKERTEQLQHTLEELRRERNLLSRLTETSPSAIAVVNNQGQIVFANPQAERLLAVTQEEILARKYNEPAWRITDFDGEPFPDEQLPFRRVMNSGQSVYDVRHAIEHPDGRRVYLSINAAPLFSATGQIEGMVATFDDISEQVLAERQKAVLEEQLRQSQKMEAVGRLAAGVAHDFNNLLTIVLACSESLLQGLPVESPLRAEAGEILEAGRRSAQVVRQLMAFSRQQPCQPQVVELNRLLIKMENMLRRLLGEDIQLSLSCQENLFPIFADPCQLQQVVINLAVNARDAMPRGGRLSIDARNVELLPGEVPLGLKLAAGKYVLLCVTDNGCGIEPELQAKIFEPFFTTKKNGTGLGLSTVYGIVKQGGGEITVKSRPGEGTCFEIYLPACLASTAVDKEPPLVERLFGQGRLALVVEDDAPLRNMMERMLTGMGFRVELAPSGPKALEMLEKLPAEPQLVISDVVMPGMSGPLLVEHIRRKFPNIRVLFISGYTAETFENYHLPENIPLLPKPFDSATLAEKLRRLFLNG